MGGNRQHFHAFSEKDAMQRRDHKRIASPFARRAFLGASAADVAGCLAAGPRGMKSARAAATPGSEAKGRPDLLDRKSPPGLEVVPLTTDASVPASHLYMEAQIFTMDWKHLVLHRSATAHGGSPSDPKHQLA